MKVSFKVSPHLSTWSGDEIEGTFAPHVVHELTLTRKVQVQQIAAAEAAGSLINVGYDSAAAEHAKDAVESDEDSLKYQEKAIADGSWGEANRELAELLAAQQAEAEESEE